MGSNDFHKKRKERNTKKKRVEKKSVLIALEDTKSSKYYFEELLKDKGLKGRVVFAEHIGTNPKKVLKAIEKYKDKNKIDNFEKEWIVIDKDSYSKNEINSVFQSAYSKGICVAFSNESYELWVLLHFEKLTKWTSRKELNSKLKKIFEDRFHIEYTKSSRDIYRYIISFQKEAIKNAKSLVEMHKQNSKLKEYCECNPLTTIFELVEYLNVQNSTSFLG